MKLSSQKFDGMYAVLNDEGHTVALFENLRHAAVFVDMYKIIDKNQAWDATTARLVREQYNK